MSGFEVILTPEARADIGRLWEECRGIIGKAIPDWRPTPLQRVDRRSRRFAETDPSSTAFLYPTDNHGGPAAPGLTHVNPRHLSEVITGIAVVLDGASEVISVYMDCQHAVEADCQ